MNVRPYTISQELKLQQQSDNGPEQPHTNHETWLQLPTGGEREREQSREQPKPAAPRAREGGRGTSRPPPECSPAPGPGAGASKLRLCGRAARGRRTLSQKVSQKSVSQLSHTCRRDHHSH